MARGLIIPMTRARAVARAFTQLIAVPPAPKGAPADAGNRPIAYRLDTANGGKDPAAGYCGDWSYGDRTMTADCVGFVCWCLGIDRFQTERFPEYGGWMNTDSILEHAHSKAPTLWRPLRPGEQPLKGDVLVSPSTRKLLVRTPGHIGLIIRPATRVSEILTIDCSPTHGRDTAIGTRTPWSKKCEVIRPMFIQEGGE